MEDAEWLGKFMGSELDKVRADHAAFVARVREIAESLGHDPDCPYFFKSCNCPRGKLLEVCNG